MFKIIASGTLSPEQLIRFQHRIEILTLQGLLKIKIYNLDFLKFFNGYEDTIRARMLYLNAYKFIQFNEKTKAIELKEPIKENYAEKLSNFGEGLFLGNGILAYIIFVIPVIFFPQYLTPNNVFWILTIVFSILIIQIYAGYKIMKFMKRKKNALELMKLKRIDSTENSIISNETNNNLNENNIISIENHSNPIDINKIPNETNKAPIKVKKINLK